MALRRLLIAATVASLTPGLALAQPAAPAAASTRTIEANRAFSKTLPWSDASEDALATRGFVATLADPRIRNAAGEVVMDLSAYDFAKGEAPDTANPSLWRHLKLLRQHGLFKVAPGIWQVRGFDISVMSILETRSGYVIVDPLTTREVAAAAMSLVRQHVGDRPVLGVIYTHSHADHYGGVKGVVDPADVAAGKVQILAPSGFMEHAVSENLVAGPAMTRRAAYQFGTSLAKGPAGQAGNGIGTIVARGTHTLIAPTRTIERTGETAEIDGLRIEFQVTPGTEAPAEMNFYLPDLKALSLAENANVTMHNILTPRGALVRDARAWAEYLGEAERLYGARTDVMFTSHGWPRWGHEEVSEFISFHRDAYKYLHDQTVRLMNKGYTPEEIAEEIELPGPLAAKWYNRGYYGTMSHNSKAVYQRYLGWYDANPVHLNPWPPEEAGKRYVAAMGGEASALQIAQKAYEAGDYRWSAEVAGRIVFANGASTAGRELLARSFEQMGYQSEGMLWRNMYLMGALEARGGPSAAATGTMNGEILQALPSRDLFEFLAIRVDPKAAAGKDVAVDFVFPERGERTRLTLRNSVLVQEKDAQGPVDATVTAQRPVFLSLLFAGADAQELMRKGDLKIDGRPLAVRSLLGSLDRGQPTAFPIVTP